MKRLMILLMLVFSLPSVAQNKISKTWSFYGNVGYGNSSLVTLEGLDNTLSAEDMQYFADRGLRPTFQTEGTTTHVMAFNAGVSRYFGQFRVSGQIGSHYVGQSNYHATNLTADLLGGYNFLKATNHELTFDVGAGYYNSYNNYVYHWEGVRQGTVIESHVCNLGEHNVHTLSALAKLSYQYNIVGKHWLGGYVQGRYNFAKNDYCPTVVASAGVEYRYTLGWVRSIRSKKQPTIVDRYVTVRDTVYVEKVVRDTTFVPTPMASFKAVVNFEFDSYELTEASKASLDAFIKQIDGEDVRVIVMGYTDGIGTFGYNLNLSYFRSAEIFGYLNHNGIPASNISYGGASFTQPIAPNTNGEDRAKNRRVEIYAVYR